MTTVVWIIGAGGMLGGAIARAAGGRSDLTLLPSAQLNWAHPDELELQVAGIARDLVERAAESGSRWSIVWAAGAAVTSATQHQLDAELTVFRRVLNAIVQQVEGYERLGTFFLASSAGGVYGGAAHPPFTEETPPVALSPYGRFKLELEEATLGLARAGVSVLIGRITNLYGPGQRLSKMQGLISHLALARLGGKPVSIFVPLETLRDYIYVDDCARLILASLDRLAHLDEPGRTVTKILGSGQGVSISTLLGYAQAIGKKRPRVILGTSPAAANQAVDLRMTSVVWPDLDDFDKTPLPAGFQSTANDILRELQNGISHD